MYMLLPFVLKTDGLSIILLQSLLSIASMICDFFRMPQVFAFLIQYGVFCILHSPHDEYIFLFYKGSLYFPLHTHLRKFLFSVFYFRIPASLS